MPTPDAGESKNDYMSRCIPKVLKEGTAKNNDQAVAICSSMWERKVEKADLSSFSLVVRAVGLNKKTGERWWKATTSDIFPDSYNDEMTLELYASFLSRITDDVPPPAEYRSEAWDGGMPYVSVAHYMEHSIAGDTTKLYVDGEMFKAQGTFRDSPLGRACFDALWRDLYTEKGETQDRVRVSIAFLDYKHRHKQSGFIFERSSIHEVCPECLKERESGERPGRQFLDGHLIHLAMTRVPVNTRTLMEVRSMTTKKEDAASIVGEPLAEELESREHSLVGKSEAEVIRSEDEDAPVYRPFGGATTMADAKAFIESGKEQRRIGDIWYAFQVVLSNIMQDEEMEMEEKSDKIKKCSDEFKAMVSNKNAAIFESLTTLSLEGDEEEINEKPDPLSVIEERISVLEKTILAALDKIEVTSAPAQVTESATHPLSVVMAQLRSDFDSVALMEASNAEKLQAIQPTFTALGETLRGLLSVETEQKAVVQPTTDGQLAAALQKLSDKIDLIASQQTRSSVAPGETIRRSIPPSSVPQITRDAPSRPSGPTPVLRSIIEKSVGLD